MFLACSKKAKPSHATQILPLGKMVEVMTDIMYADAYGYDNGFTNQTYSGEYMRAKIYPSVFKKHQIKDTIFYNSYSFYEKHPEKLKMLMDSLTSVYTKLQNAEQVLEGETNDKDSTQEKNENAIRDNPNNPFGNSPQAEINARKKIIFEQVQKDKREQQQKENPGK